MLDRQKLKRRAGKTLIGPMLRWRRQQSEREGFSIILGTPWSLRHLLSVNLEFIARADLAGLDKIVVVFDRRTQPGAEQFISQIRDQFPSLPIDIHFQPRVVGAIVERIDQSKFYASLNWVIGLSECRTRYAVLHDFDLYPVASDHFTALASKVEQSELRFTGYEYTAFDSLDTSDGVIGTWSLTIDVDWLRSHHRPIDCFHAVGHIGDRRVDLDPFSQIQLSTSRRELTPGGSDSFAHVDNLVSTYLRYTKGERVAVAWRMHYLWYLEDLADEATDIVARTTAAMDAATSSMLTVDGRTVDMADVHVSVVDVLADELKRMDEARHGCVRSKTLEYIEATRRFLERHGEHEQVARSGLPPLHPE